MTGFIEQIPAEVEESARTDGANGIKTFFLVVFPLAAPGIVATSIFVALLAWNEFLIPVLLAGEDSKTLPVYISGFVSARTLDWGPMAAASSLAIVPIALFTALIQRRLVTGLSSGAVKE
jgi:ABC-type glycerol-3-phosphate transport system permease component